MNHICTNSQISIKPIGIGIGHAVGFAFAQNGYHVIVTDILKTEGTETVTKIRANGGSAEYQYLDVTCSDSANEVIKNVVDRFGGVDCIVANAGVAYKIPNQNLSDENWDETFNINLKGMLRVIRPAIPSMQKRQRGTIICLTSLMGLAYGWDKHVQYSSAKAGVIGLVRGLAVELAKDGIRVNGIAPGYIRTAQLLNEEHSMGPINAELAGNYIPMGRIGEPAEVADVAVFLASHSSRYMTGQVLVVDGGLLVGRN